MQNLNCICLEFSEFPLCLDEAMETLKKCSIAETVHRYDGIKCSQPKWDTSCRLVVSLQTFGHFMLSVNLLVSKFAIS